MSNNKKPPGQGGRRNLSNTTGCGYITVLEADESVAYAYQSVGFHAKNGSTAESGLEFSSREVPVASLSDVEHIFAELHDNPLAIAVLGRAPSGRVKLSDQFEDRLSHVAIFEIGIGGNKTDIESTIRAMRPAMPKQFHSLDCVWSISPRKDPADFQRAYLAFWLLEAMSLKDLAALVKREGCTRYQRSQCRYTGGCSLARPNFAEGLVVPLPGRQRILRSAVVVFAAEGYTPKTVTICTAQKQGNQVRFKTKVFGLRDGKLMKIDGTSVPLYSGAETSGQLEGVQRSPPRPGGSTKLSVLGAFVGDRQATFEKNKSVRLTAGRGMAARPTLSIAKWHS